MFNPFLRINCVLESKIKRLNNNKYISLHLQLDMREKVLKIIKYIFFLGLGIGLTYWQSKGMNLQEELEKAKNMKWGFFGLSVIFGMIAHFSRAVRWRYLIQPLGYNPRLINVFFSVMFMYLSNILVPRSGEVARCGSLYKYEKIPVSKLLGTVVVERLSDLAMLFLLTIFLFFLEFEVLQRAYYETSAPNFVASILNNKLVIVVCGLTAIGAIFVIIAARKRLSKNKFIGKAFNFIEEAKEGVLKNDSP